MSASTITKSIMIGLLIVPIMGFAADKTAPVKPAPQAAYVADKEPIFGYQLMTPAERTTFRTQMQNATTAEERQKIRLQHRTLMLERAKAQGVTLPDTPMMNNQGIGSGRAGKGGMMNGNGYGRGKNQ